MIMHQLISLLVEQYQCGFTGSLHHRSTPCWLLLFLKSEILLEGTIHFQFTKEMKKVIYNNTFAGCSFGMPPRWNVWWQKECTFKAMHGETHYGDGWTHTRTFWFYHIVILYILL
jgi:hypothetical protein